MTTLVIRKILSKGLIVGLLCMANTSFAEDSDKLEFSGFVRAVAGYVNEKDTSFNGYDDNLTFDSESLVGLRLDYEISDKLNIVSQGVAYANEDRKSKIQWLYADYRPTNNLSFKIGRQRAPLFVYSEVIDVGFAYPWISLPESIYIPYLFNEIDGVLGTYEFAGKNYSGSLDAYYGKFDSDIDLTGRRVSADVDDFHGLVGALNIGEFNIRASYHKAHAEVIIEELEPLILTLNQLGFFESAQALLINDSARYNQIAIDWDSIDYFAKFEFSKFDSASTLIAKTQGFYATLGYNFAPFTAHLTYSFRDAEPSQTPNDIPLGFDPQLDFLAAQIASIAQSTAGPDIEHLTLGLRYDYKSNLAFKADVKYLVGEPRNFDSDYNSIPFYAANDAVLFQFAMEWVF